MSDMWTIYTHFIINNKNQYNDNHYYIMLSMYKHPVLPKLYRYGALLNVTQSSTYLNAIQKCYIYLKEKGFLNSYKYFGTNSEIRLHIAYINLYTTNTNNKDYHYEKIEYEEKNVVGKITSFDKDDLQYQINQYHCKKPIKTYKLRNYICDGFSNGLYIGISSIIYAIGISFILYYLIKLY